MSKPVILTGIRANNDLHIGNYFGALLPMVDMAKKHAGDYQINLFVPDLHSFITPIDHTELFHNTMNNVRIFVAAGLPLDHPDIHVYRQSFIPAHSELTWILNCFTGMGELGRMTQYKDKSQKLSEEHINAGLFGYPVLMAADILLYGAVLVPVGDDQTQHLEFTRNIGDRMNARFGNLFTVPKPVKEQHSFFGKDQGLRIKDLIDPTKKMSKSDELGRGVIFLGDDPAAAAKKIMGATTDSLGEIHFDREKQPGISNLLEILALLKGQSLSEVVEVCEGKTSYGELKSEVAERVQSFLTEFQQRLAAVDEATITAKLEASEDTMREVASKTLYKVQRAVGLRPTGSILDDENLKRYTELLDGLQMAYKVVEHPDLRTPKDTQAYLGLTMADGLSTMIVRVGDSYVAILRRDDCRLDFDKIKRLVGDGVRMATHEEFTELTGLQPGAARVYNPGLKTYLDRKLFEKEYLTGGSGSFLCSIRYRVEDLKKIPGSEVVDVLNVD